MNHARHILSLLLLAAFWLPAQSFPADSVYQVQHQEKVYLHFDNAGYFLRETMWFKAYVLDESNRPTDISRVLYVELVSPEGGVVETHKCKIEDGMAHGDFYLDSAYLSGFFEVRAYTRHMRNFGEENYFSRVFPVFEEAVGGDYSVRTMYDRLRPEGLGKDNNPTLRERVLQARKAKNDTLPWPVQKAANAVIRYNRRFNPEPIRCDSIPEDLRPGEKVTLTFRTTPRSTFSLSVCEEESYIRTGYRGDICRTMFRDSGWVARSYRALRDFDPKTDIRYAPEKGIVVDGDISYSKRGKSVFPPGVAVFLNLSDSATILKGRTQSDSLGRWSFTIEDFYGEKKACLATLKYLPKNRSPWLRTHKWFSPVPRQYAADELHLPAAANTTYTIRTDDSQEDSNTGKSRTLRQVDVTAKLPKLRWRNTTRSVVHYSYAEEKEYLLDTSIGLPATTTLVVGTLLHRYYYPFRPFRTIIIDRYEGDHTVPEGKCNDNPWIEIDSIKEVVIRTDHAAIQRYDYDNERIKKFTYGGMGNTTGGGPTQAGVILDDGYPFYPPPPGDTQGRHRDMYAPEPPLCYSAFLVKYTPEEIKGHPEWLMKSTPTSRVTVVRGFTRPSGFPAPDYSASREGLENDFRRTLYWNPNVRTDENGIARVTFYNNARCRNLHISAEGIGGDGNPVVYHNTSLN